MFRGFKLLIATLAVVAVAGGVVAANAAAATPVTVGSGWHLFQWSGGDGAVPFESPYTFSSTGPVVVTVTDAFCKGDRFTISDGATTLGTTNAVPIAPTCPFAGNPGDTGNPSVALADPGYSHGIFAVGPGAHSIGIVVSTSPFGGGGAFIRFDAMTADMCKNGGWQSFGGQFKNQGDCVSFVATQGKNPGDG